MAGAFLGLGFWCIPAVAQENAEQTILEISFLFEADTELPVKGQLVLRPQKGEGEPVRQEIVSAAPLSLRLPSGSMWEVSAEIQGFWVRRTVVALGPPAQAARLSLALWPLGKISGVAKVKGAKEALPRQMLVETLAAPAFAKRPSAPKGTLDCPVDEKGNWSCSLPAATYDLVISAKGLTRHYRWSVPVPPGKTVHLGTIELERGASVAGWVAVEEGGIEPECIARLSPLVAGGADLKSAAKLDRTAREQKVRKEGFLQLTGLAPGNYALLVEQPGFAPVRINPVRVDPGAETFLREPILLRRPLDLQFEIIPPVDWLGQPWRAQVIRNRELPPSPIVFQGAVGEDGRLTVSGQSGGRFRIGIRDSLGNTLYSNEHWADSSNAGPHSIELHVVSVEGRVRLGDSPLAATLWFGGRSGATSSKMESDEDGWFHGVLPQEGLWRIEVQATEPAITTWTRAEVDASRAGKASLDIVLPDTRVFGRVVDEVGKPVAGADVVIQAESESLFSTADASGRFETRGLPEGLVWLGAETASRVSNRAFAVLAEGSSAGPIELRLRPAKLVTGRVVSSQGPVTGARVLLLAGDADGGGAQAVTDTSGTFQVDLPKEVTRIEAIVSAPGFALKAFGGLSGNEPLMLSVAEEAGGLALALPPGVEVMRKSLVLAAFQDGFYIPGSVLNQWAFDHGGQGTEFRIPKLAPGHYAVCFVPQYLAGALLMASVPSGSGCDTGILAPGAILSLQPKLPD